MGFEMFEADDSNGWADLLYFRFRIRARFPALKLYLDISRKHSGKNGLRSRFVPSGPGSILGVPKIFSDFEFSGLEFLDVVEI